ncbi:unnamed protein product [Discosporangium mesarthrocarpum]
MKLESELCAVCSDSTAKYRCPGCSIPCCSLACSKAHKTTSRDGRPPCSGKRERPNEQRNSENPVQPRNSNSSTEERGPGVAGKRQRVTGGQANATGACDLRKQGAAGFEKPPAKEGDSDREIGNGNERVDGSVEIKEGGGVSRLEATSEGDRNAPRTLEGEDDEEWQLCAEQKQLIARSSYIKAALRDPKLQALLIEIDRARDPEKVLCSHRSGQQFGEFVDRLLLEIGEYRKGKAGEPTLVAVRP